MVSVKRTSYISVTVAGGGGRGALGAHAPPPPIGKKNQKVQFDFPFFPYYILNLANFFKF